MTVPVRHRSPGQILGRLWLTVVLPLFTLPVIFIAGLVPPSPVVSHATFHLLYLPILVVAGLLAVGLLRSAAPRPVRVLGGVIAVLHVVAFVGHAGELWVVMTNGGFGAPESVFEHPAHESFANFTPLSILAAALAVMVATVVWAVGRRRTRRTAGSAPAQGASR